MRILVVTGAIALGVVACGEVKQAVVQGVHIGVVESVGQAEIEKVAGVKLEGDLDCAMKDLKAGESTPINCTGKTKDGLPVTLTGSATEVVIADKKDYAKGTFAATVDGREIFSKACLGTC